MLEEPIVDHLSLTEHHCGEQFTTCSVSVLCSYDPSMRTVVPKTLTWEVTVAVTSESHLETKVTLNFPPSVHHSEGTDVHNPSKESITQRQHIPTTPYCHKLVPCPISLHNNVSFTSSTCNRANAQHMVEFIPDPFPENVPAHTLDRPNNRYRLWISGRSACVSLHHCSPHNIR